MLIPSVFALIVNGLILSSSRAEMTVHLCECSWPPYIIGKEGSAPTGGLVIEYLQDVFDRIEGVRLKVTLYPWMRCLNYMENGNADGGAILLFSEERSAFLEYSMPYYTSRLVFFYSVDRYPQHLQLDMDSVWTQFKIGHVSGFVLGDRHTRAVRSGLIFDTAANTALCLKKLVENRFDLYCDEERNVIAVIRKLGYQDKVKTASPPIEEKKYYMAISKKSPAVELMPRINMAINASIEDGTRDRIFQ